MKSAIIIFILFSSLIFAQIPDKVNTITITDSTKDVQTLFTEFGKFLIKQGYELKQVDKSFLLLSTEPLLIKTGLLNLQKVYQSIEAEVIENPNRIILRAYFVDGNLFDLKDKEDFQDERNRAKNSSGTYEKSFELLNELVLKFSKDLTYSIEVDK